MAAVALSCLSGCVVLVLAGPESMLALLCVGESSSASLGASFPESGSGRRLASGHCTN